MIDRAYIFLDEFEKTIYEIFEKTYIFDEESKKTNIENENTYNRIFESTENETAQKNIFTDRNFFENSIYREEKTKQDIYDNLNSISYTNEENLYRSFPFFYENANNNYSENFENNVRNKADIFGRGEERRYNTKNIFNGENENIKSNFPDNKNISVSVTNNISVKEECDIDYVIERLCEKISDAVEAAGEGRHI